MAKRPAKSAKKVLRAASDELGLTTPKTVQRGRGIVKNIKKPGSRVKKV